MNADAFEILSLRERAQVKNDWLQYRMKNILPEIMRREGVRMWIVAGREYNEGPLLMTFLPAEMLSARRRSILIFHLREDESIEYLFVGRHGITAKYGLDQFYSEEWDHGNEGQWECVARLVDERNPESVGVNVSETFAFGDELTHSEYERLVRALKPEYADRLRSAERPAVGWLERRTPAELQAYERIMEIAHTIIAEAFSTRVIHPGITTADDVQWWMRERVHGLGLRSWFQPSVSIQAPDVTFRSAGARRVIRPGDLLHCDFGLTYLGLCTDTQQLGYVLHPGEEAAPAGLRDALAVGNRLQDIHAGEMAEGRTGNEILASALRRMREEGIEGKIYTHPIGYHGHGAGPTIGLTDMQGGVAGRGDYQLFNDTCHAMELNVQCAVPEWDGETVRMGLEQDIAFTGDAVHYIGGRQTQLHLVGP